AGMRPVSTTWRSGSLAKKAIKPETPSSTAICRRPIRRYWRAARRWTIRSSARSPTAAPSLVPTTTGPAAGPRIFRAERRPTHGIRSPLLRDGGEGISFSARPGSIADHVPARRPRRGSATTPHDLRPLPIPGRIGDNAGAMLRIARFRPLAIFALLLALAGCGVGSQQDLRQTTLFNYAGAIRWGHIDDAWSMVDP